MAVSVRFVLTGACHPYSGRQVLFALPLQSTPTNPTTISEVKSIVRRCWPAGELPLIAGSIQSIGLKILKTGKLLTDDQTLSSALTPQEIQESATQAHTFGTGFDDSTQSVSRTVLMHLVFHSVLPAAAVVAGSVAPQSNSRNEPNDASRRSDRRQQSVGDDTGCSCSLM